MFKKNQCYKACQIALGVNLGLGLSIPGYAGQDAPVNSDEIEKIEITGSRIKRTDLETASPIVVINADDMAIKGMLSVEDALSNLSQNAGNIGQSAGTNGFAPSTSSINLRGLGAGRTLFLLDGKRMPVFPIANGTDNFFNLSAIPLSAVERMEIVTDGGSAIYGSDAMAGVVNIILKKNLANSGLNLLTSTTNDGGGDRNRAQFFSGTSSESTNISFVAEYEKKDAMLASDRQEVMNRKLGHGPTSQSHLFNGPNGLENHHLCGDFNGTIINDICRLTITDSWGLLPETEKYSIMANMSQALTNDLNLNARVIYTGSETEMSMPPIFWGGPAAGNVNEDSAVYTPVNPQILPGHASFVGDPNDPANASGGTVIWRTFNELSHSSIPDGTGGTKGGEDDTVSFMLALSGTVFEDYEWDSSITYSKQTTATTGWGILHTPIANLIETDSSFNLWAKQDQAFFDKYVRQWRMDGESTTLFADAVLSGELESFELPAGQIGFALAADFERNIISNIPNQFLASGESGSASSGVKGERNRFGVGIEALFPVLDSLNITGALRYDEYDDATDIEGRMTSMVKFEWRPIDDLLVRGTWGETFRAPDLQRVYASNSASFAPGLTDTKGNDDPADDEVITNPVLVESDGGLGLEEETGTTSNIGLVYSPTKDFNISLDYYKIEIEGRVEQIAAQTIINNDDSDRIIRDADDNIVKILSGNENTSFNDVSGIDLTISYNTQIGDYGNITTAFYWSHVLENDTQFDETEPVIDQLATNNSMTTDRGSFTLGWNYENISSTLFINHVGEVPTALLSDDVVDSWTTANLSMSYTLSDMVKFNINANNITNSMPPVDDTMASPGWGVPYNFWVHNIIGREITASVDISF